MRLTRATLRTALGLLGAAVFVVLYVPELFSHHGPPVTLRWLEAHTGKAGVIAVHLVAVGAFLLLLPYRRDPRRTWRSRGAFLAFVLALMTEMFGWPLLIYLLSPLVDVPSLRGLARRTLGHTGPILGTWLSMAGVVLVVAGWKRVHAATGLVTDGIYRFVRHPQYLGLFLFTFGWLLHWPTVLTLVLWPILTAAYAWLARREERGLKEQFGDAYRAYAQRTPRFFPRVIPRPG
ncbi:MAG: methyltransferase family protein [Planctomycetota bacterium]